MLAQPAPPLTFVPGRRCSGSSSPARTANSLSGDARAAASIVGLVPRQHVANSAIAGRKHFHLRLQGSTRFQVCYALGGPWGRRQNLPQLQSSGLQGLPGSARAARAGHWRSSILRAAPHGPASAAALSPAPPPVPGASPRGSEVSRRRSAPKHQPEALRAHGQLHPSRRGTSCPKGVQSASSAPSAVTQPTVTKYCGVKTLLTESTCLAQYILAEGLG
mmetsp:Transcript_62201/g.145778  ORF Transcript_62201/g.145778 Transcript_62201/m.145778 type:complete len:219 (+) Transcript_62201:800-1456(+)